MQALEKICFDGTLIDLIVYLHVSPSTQSSLCINQSRYALLLLLLLYTNNFVEHENVTMFNFQKAMKVKIVWVEVTHDQGWQPHLEDLCWSFQPR